MERLIILVFSAFIIPSLAEPSSVGETILSTVLTPDAKEKTLTRQGRSYYDPRLGPRPLYDRLEYGRPEYDRPSRCGRCYEESRYDDRDDRDYDRSRDRDGYDDDRRGHRPTSGSRHDRNRNDNDEDDRRYSTDRNNNNNNGTDDENDGDNKKRPYDDKDDRDRPGSNRHRNRNRDRDRNRYDDRDKYRPDYYDRFLSRDPYRERPGYERPYYEDPYRERRPLYDRYDDPYAAGGFGGRYDGYGYPGYQRPARPAYEDRYNRGNGYDDVYGGYGPGVGRGPHDSFRPWDETYRGQAGWDAGGRGYYFASGRPEPAPAAAAPIAPAAPAWARPEYGARPAVAESGWQSAGAGYAGGYRDYRDPVDYRGSLGYGQQEGGYRQDISAGYGQAAQGGGWHSVGERIRPYRDQSGVNQIDNRDRDRDRDSLDQNRDRYPTRDRYPGNRQPAASYGTTFGQSTSSSTTQQTSYLYQRDEQLVTKPEETTPAS
ncbi:hypothetical protein O0L34_g6272 [Tuta absoluta]|nr:hypothetical protein O0L34_g6272 [Tuta absoluta]